MMIKLQQVTYCYEEVSFDFNLQLATGEMTVILGPSGAGKSTLLSLIAGFITPKQGEIWLNQQRCDHLTAAERPISILFQDNNLFPHLTVFQNIALGLNPSLRLTVTEQEVIYQIAEELQISAFLKRYPDTLSGGQRQRVALARCFIRQQPILLLDEPFAALDPRSRYEMMELLQQLCLKKNTTLLLVSHQVDEVLSQFNRAIIVDTGQIIFDGLPTQLLKQDAIYSDFLGFSSKAP